MSLTTEDLQAIRSAIVDTVAPMFELVNEQLDRLEQTSNRHSQILNEHTKILNDHSRTLAQHSQLLNEHSGQLRALNDKVDDLFGKLKAVEADIKELYGIAASLRHNSITDRKFAKLPADKKLLTIHAELLSLAQQLNVTLPA